MIGAVTLRRGMQRDNHTIFFFAVDLHCLLTYDSAGYFRLWEGRMGLPMLLNAS